MSRRGATGIPLAHALPARRRSARGEDIVSVQRLTRGTHHVRSGSGRASHRGTLTKYAQACPQCFLPAVTRYRPHPQTATAEHWTATSFCDRRRSVPILILGPATTTLHAPTALRDRAPNGARPLQVTGGRLRVNGCRLRLQPCVPRQMRDRRQIFARIYDLLGGGACSPRVCRILDFAARICARW